MGILQSLIQKWKDLSKFVKLAIMGLLVVIVAAVLALIIWWGPAITTGTPVVGSPHDAVSLEQGWSQRTQQAFYWTAQGSRMLPYDWFMALEQEGSTKRFRDDDHMEKLRLLASKPVPFFNGDGLPVGFVKDKGENGSPDWIGVTCAACHTAEIEYKGTRIRIDGGPTMADMQGFNAAMNAALTATAAMPDKFKRFADNVLGSGATETQRATLMTDLKAQTKVLTDRFARNHPDLSQGNYGFGRVDAIGWIYNQVLAVFSKMPENGLASDAPVSFPFLWGTHQSDVVQWTGFAPNGPFSAGALIRNTGEVMGAFGQLSLSESTSTFKYESSVRIPNLGLLEKWVAELRSPVWPTAYLPELDAEKVKRGKLLFARDDLGCARCHQVIPREKEGDSYQAELTKISVVRTDPTQWENMLRTVPAGPYEGRRSEGIIGGPIPNPTSGLNPLVNVSVGALLRRPLEALGAAVFSDVRSIPEIVKEAERTADQAQEKFKDMLEEHRRQMEMKPSPTTAAVSQDGVYKARPLNGIWATAPYLHNGSVPNLWQLLKPSDRAEKFNVGTRAFDPKHVGFKDGGEFEFDTTKKGNSNQGHDYGASLSDDERWDLIEYMKTL